MYDRLIKLHWGASMEVINHRRAQLSGTVLNNVDARVLHSDASREMLASATQV
jgi:hypothetical protein